MSTKLSPEKIIGFSNKLISSYSANTLEEKKLLSAIKSLWNNKDGKHESSKFKIVDSSGKGFYDRTGEFVVLDKNTKTLYLCEASTNYSSNWKAKDDVRIIGIKNNGAVSQSNYGGVFG